MGAKSIIFVALAAIISVGLGAPATINTDKIKAAASQLECVAKTILPIDQKHGLGDLWLPIYFPIVMHTNTLYECQAQKSQPQSDECADEEMREAVYTLVGFLENVYENHSDVALEIHAALVSQCELDVPSPDDEFIYLSRKVSLNKFNFKKYFNIEHIKCVVQSLVVAIGDNNDALDWITYNIELKESIERIIACNKYVGMDKKVCIVTELKTTIKVLLDLWKFFAEKKHVQVLAHIKAEIKGKCYKKPFLM
ncbi:uncharacterized protein LOC129574068 isoform X2 [Sitodiplosis mosellana]|uniref:uncharacterized protein LOC129574068 isoform X2 n=1 Tax=Sitodiplosis mosellana TaxID=263140 RepID=UPI002444402A|nr:uncharacterized protein LOC129574068 isoform X2 [Sitodiplosis mosellana]